MKKVKKEDKERDRDEGKGENKFLYNVIYIPNIFFHIYINKY